MHDNQQKDLPTKKKVYKKQISLLQQIQLIIQHKLQQKTNKKKQKIINEHPKLTPNINKIIQYLHYSHQYSFNSTKYHLTTYCYVNYSMSQCLEIIIIPSIRKTVNITKNYSTRLVCQISTENINICSRNISQYQYSYQQNRLTHKITTQNQQHHLTHQPKPCHLNRHSKINPFQPITKNSITRINNLNQNNQNNIIYTMYTQQSSSNDQTIKQLQNNYLSFTNNTINQQKYIQNQQSTIFNQLNLKFNNFNTFQNQYYNKIKSLQSLQIELQQKINEQFQNINIKFMDYVTKLDMQDYKIQQKQIFDSFNQLINNKIENLVPQTLQNILPIIQEKLKQIDKIHQIQHSNLLLQTQLKQLQIKTNKQNTTFSQKISQLDNTINTTNTQLTNSIFQNISSTQNKLTNTIISIIQQLKLQLKSQFSQQIKTQTQQFQKILSSKSTNHNQQHDTITINKQQLPNNNDQIQNILQQFHIKFNQIQQLSNIIVQKIQSYSNKTTKMKSDLQLFMQATRKQLAQFTKFKQKITSQLTQIGSMLSYFTQITFINTSLHIQTTQQQSLQPNKFNQPLVFVTEHDDIIYQWKPQNKKGILQYRKQKLQSKQFLLSYFYSLVSSLDNKLLSLNIINWDNQKPSKFFHDVIMKNYLISIKRIIQSQTKQMKQRKSFSQLSNHHYSQNHIQFNQQNTLNLHCSLQVPNNNVKPYNQVEENENDSKRKAYNRKRQNLTSGKLSSRTKKHPQSNHPSDRQIFTTRATCRSRISQIF